MSNQRDVQQTVSRRELLVGLAAGAAVLGAGPAAAAREPVFAVVTDDRLPVYKKVTTGIGVEAQANFFEFTLGGNAKKGDAVMRQVLAKKPAVILAVGPKAANAAKRATKDIPVVFCLVPRLQNYDLSRPNIAGVRLERSTEAQLETLRKIVPKLKRVAVLYNPAESERTIKAARKAARGFGIDIVGLRIKRPADAKKALSGAPDVDALWMVSDRTVLNLTTFDAMLKFSMARKVPFFALNDKLVARGALVSFAIDYARVGQQVGRIANRIAFERVPIGRVGVVPPDGLNVAINLTTARRVGAACDLALDVFTYAADNNYAIQVFK